MYCKKRFVIKKVHIPILSLEDVIYDETCHEWLDGDDITNAHLPLFMALSLYEPSACWISVIPCYKLPEGTFLRLLIHLKS